MTARRWTLAVLAVFLTSQVLAIIVHGFVLAADYAPLYGTLLRPMDGSAAGIMLVLPLAHLAMAIGFVALYVRGLGSATSPALSLGLRFGVLAWLLGPVPMDLLWFANQPWPGMLTLKRIGLELCTMLVLGAVAAATCRRRA